jgi:Zn-dependent protease with chaperone function
MMGGVLELVALSSVALLGFGLLAGTAAAIAHEWVSRSVRAVSPSLRSRILLAWAAAPATAAIALVAAALWPSLGAALGLAVDHCPMHAGHVHLCVHHLPARGLGIAGALGLGLLGVVAGTVLVRAIRSAALATRLARLPSFEYRPGLRAVESYRAFAFTVGWLRPKVVVSTALVERLTPAQLDVVVAHERAHVARRDALTVTIARVLALAHLPAIRRGIVAELMLACEQACDETAALAVGDRVLVAETIVAAERAAASAVPAPVPALAFGGGEVVHRVESLLAEPRGGGESRRVLWAVLTVGAALAALAPEVHHLTETFLELLPH